VKPTLAFSEALEALDIRFIYKIDGWHINVDDLEMYK
jgi:hypothetical protein